MLYIRSYCAHLVEVHTFLLWKSVINLIFTKFQNFSLNVVEDLANFTNSFLCNLRYCKMLTSTICLERPPYSTISIIFVGFNLKIVTGVPIKILPNYFFSFYFTDLTPRAIHHSLCWITDFSLDEVFSTLIINPSKWRFWGYENSVKIKFATWRDYEQKLWSRSK